MVLWLVVRDSGYSGQASLSDVAGDELAEGVQGCQEFGWCVQPST